MFKRFEPSSFRFVAIFLAAFFIWAVLAEEASARSRAGGRSFGGGGSFSSRPAAPKAPALNPGMRAPGIPQTGGFMRGLGAGLLGGFMGSLLFGGVGHGMGMGGFGGSGFGLIEILLIGGLLYFFYRRFVRPPAASHSFSGYPGSYGSAEDASAQPILSSYPEDPVAEGIERIQRLDATFDPERFKEFAQDVFFKVQAGWGRRDLASFRNLLGARLSEEYDRHFQEMREGKRINRLENIAVRQVRIAAADIEGGEAYVTVRFTANLLDYWVDDATGKILEGSPTEPVKFEEEWTWAKPVESAEWRLEGLRDPRTGASI